MPGDANDAIGAMPADFVALLLGRADPQDLAACPEAAQHRLAEGAWRHLTGPREPGHPDIRLVDHDIEGGHDIAGIGRPREITVLQVINDNKRYEIAFKVPDVLLEQLRKSRR